MKTRIALLTAVVALAGCGTHSQPNTIYMPDMVYSPAFKAQELESNRMPVKGTVPRGYQSYQFANVTDANLIDKSLKNPVRRTAAALERGKAMFNTYCIVCHGAGGEGDGPVAPKFGRPPSLLSDKVRGWGDWNIFHVITQGQNLMPNYRGQVAPADRWAIIHYIRALQRAKKPTAEDLKVANQ